MRQLESFDAWRVAQDLGEAAYRLTMEPPLNQHFRLVDQIRGAAISIPANIAEGYALGTTTQFMRCLRISLGSAAELRSHLELTHRLKLADREQTAKGITLCMRVIAILVGLLRKLGRNTGSRFPFPVSRFPTNPSGPAKSS
jgi:four helix bundle protein